MGGGHEVMLRGYSGDASARLAVVFSLIYVSEMRGQLSPVYPYKSQYFGVGRKDVGNGEKHFGITYLAV